MVLLTGFVWLWVKVQEQTRQPLQLDGPALLQQRQKEPSQGAALESSKCDRYGSPRTTSSFGKKAQLVGITNAEADSVLARFKRSSRSRAIIERRKREAALKPDGTIDWAAEGPLERIVTNKDDHQEPGDYI